MAQKSFRIVFYTAGMSQETGTAGHYVL